MAVSITVFSAVLALVGMTVSVLLTQYNPSKGWFVFLGVIGVVAVSIAVPLTAWVGKRRYQRAWKLFQPFQGGFTFIALQAVGWTLFGTALLMAIGVFYQVLNDEHIDRFIFKPIAAGTTGVLSQVLLLISLQFFDRTAGMPCRAKKSLSFDAMTKRPRSVRSLDMEFM